MSVFPEVRLRRLRKTRTLRSMVRETELRTKDLIYPLFVVEGKGIEQEVTAMPGIYRRSVDLLRKEIEEVAGMGIPAVLLFGVPLDKDDAGTRAYDNDGVVQQAVKAIKQSVPELVVITDVCLCEYTSHGHCGIILDDVVDNDKTLEFLARTALSHAAAGADIVAPSDMMDGRVSAIRQTLDEGGFQQTCILSYAVKYASAFYGPFREAAGSTPQFGDRLSYQMDPPNWREALREVEQDIIEGADMVMVKPALAYLDIISRVRETFNSPLAAYNVSGEYAMIKAAARQGWIDERKAVMETLTAIKRAGADLIITYHAREAAPWLEAQK